jgi:3-phosphoshikimate 1-carboxyvinyltransferase
MVEKARVPNSGPSTTTKGNGDGTVQPLIAYPAGSLSGDCRVPGDKSVSHRAVLIGALAVGETTVRGLLEGEDVLRTLAAIRALGAGAERSPDGVWRIRGVGIGGLVEPEDMLDMGNSGTAARLLLGVLAGHPITCFMTGDHSLRTRPMNRVADPLRRTGAEITTRSGGRLPLTITGAADPVPITYRPPVASAQVKSAVLLAGLNAAGETTVVEQSATRDHTERMLRHFGADLRIAEVDEGTAITVAGQPELTASAIDVPADISSAAFPLVAALLTDGSSVTFPGVGMNPGRIGLLQTLKEMGADIGERNPRDAGGEPVADLVVRNGALRGVEVPAARAPSMIDEYPILAVAAAAAQGKTVMRGSKPAIEISRARANLPSSMLMLSRFLRLIGRISAVLPLVAGPLHAQFLPADVGTTVNGYQDDFEGDALGTDWLDASSRTNVLFSMCLASIALSENRSHRPTDTLELRTYP